MSPSRPSVFLVVPRGASALAERVRALADRLRSDGIDVILDRRVEEPPEGWRAWTERQLQDCDQVLLVWATAHRDELENEHITPHRGQYEVRAEEDELLVILFEDEAKPDVLGSGIGNVPWFRLPGDYDALRRVVFHGVAWNPLPAPDGGALPDRARPAGESWGEQIEAAQHAGDLEARESPDPSWSPAPGPDAGLDDHLWDTGSAAALDVLARRIPVTTRGSTIIAHGRVRHMQRPVPRCPDCDGTLHPAIVSIRFELAPDATAVQRVPGHRCTCGSEWPDPFAMRAAHAAAFERAGEPAQ